MPLDLDRIFSFNAAALRLRNYRAQVLAANIANAETPGYRARDFDFRAALRQATGGAPGGPGGGLRLRTSDPRHLPGPAGGAARPALAYRVPLQPSRDGNTVSLPLEQAAFARNTVMEAAALRFLNGQIKGLLLAIQGGPTR
ncbi:MAG: flagellar basal body rod protein FlgB [Gammaproteobacteria bacterium]|nr:MAG: flagellar basal body rod protein FlgB [Gammaproteobacteria bacterium]